jgi:Family of unknown function (DUF5317)
VVLVLVVAVVALAVSLATGGARLARVRIRAVRLLAAAAVVQVGTSVLVPGSGIARATALVLTTVLVGLFLVGNARLPGVPLVALGLLLNVVVVGANAAMPVSVSAAARAGIERSDLHLARDAMREPTGSNTRFAVLGDVVPVALPTRPQVVSPGDVLVAAGVCLLLLTGGARRRQTPRRAVRSRVLANESTTMGSYS